MGYVRGAAGYVVPPTPVSAGSQSRPPVQRITIVSPLLAVHLVLPPRHLVFDSECTARTT